MGRRWQDILIKRVRSIPYCIPYRRNPRTQRLKAGHTLGTCSFTDQIQTCCFGELGGLAFMTLMVYEIDRNLCYRGYDGDAQNESIYPQNALIAPQSDHHLAQCEPTTECTSSLEGYQSCMYPKSTLFASGDRPSSTNLPILPPCLLSAACKY